MGGLVSAADLAARAHFERRRGIFTTTAKGQDILNKLAPSDKSPAQRKVFVKYMSNSYPVLAETRQTFKNFDPAWNALVADCKQDRPMNTYTPSNFAIAREIKKKLNYDFFYDVLVPAIHREWDENFDYHFSVDPVSLHTMSFALIIFI
ncbi:hypothetical protein KCU78_g3050, partial [Aureobasidium melanogenum]